MFHHLSILAITATLINSVPIDNSKTITDDIIEDNIINVDEQPEKQVELDLTSVPLGSQFAIDYFFPDRKKLVTGHRIPLHLFPVETQNKILEVEDVEEDLSEKTEESEKYVDSSSFRENTSPVASSISPAELTIRNLFGQEREGDKTYQDTLSVFAPPSFFS